VSRAFLVVLLAMPRFSSRECLHKSIIINLISAIVVAFTLIVNLGAGSRAASPALAQPNTTTRASRARSSAIRRAIAASDEILDRDRARQRISGRKPAGVDSSAGGKANGPGICCLAMVEPNARHPEAPEPDPQGRCVCGEKVTIADAQDVTLPNGRPGWQGYCPECGAPMFAIRRRPTAS
jgi:hypothetical protein